MQWISSEGGPLLLIPDDLLADWNGVSPRSNFHSDYEGACTIEDYLGVIVVGRGQGLVLDDEPFETTWLGNDEGGLFVRWRFALDEPSVVRHLQDAGSARFQPTGLQYQTSCRRSVLFDAAVSGMEVAESHLNIILEPGVYEIETAEFEPDSKTALVLHRLVRKGTY
jgi:hypothetical protein